MIQEAHLLTFELTLLTRSPVFVGSGKQYTKKEYIYDSKSNMVSLLDEHLLFSWLAEHGLADAYEHFIMAEPRTTLLEFLTDTCHVPRQELDSWVRCRIYAGDALDDRHTLKEIHRFVRDGQDRVYVPGSSIKGALRTTLLKAFLLQSGKQGPSLAPWACEELEAEVFHTLTLKRDRNQNVQTKNALNSLLQGVRISDSLPISNRQLCLAGKLDEFTDGTYSRINLCRECLRPGTEIRCTLTLDQSVLRGAITVDSICKAIAESSAYYQKTVLAHYPHAQNYMTPETILLGGGVGFQSKTILEPYCGSHALKETVETLQRRFPRHNHRDDPLDGVSPRALKQTDLDGMSYPYGVCEVKIR